MTLLQPPHDLGPPERQAFTILAHLAGRAAALHGIHLIPGDAILLSHVSMLVVRVRREARAGRLAEAVELTALAQELAANYWVRIPESLLPTVGRA